MLNKRLLGTAGIPENVRVAGSNDSQAGNELPLLKAAEYVNES